MTRTITIIIHDNPNDYTVQEGEDVCNRLCWDEMLGTVAELTHPRIAQARYRMDAGDRIVNRMERAAEMRRKLAAEVAAEEKARAEAEQ